MKNPPVTDRTLQSLSRKLLSMRNRYFFALDLLIFCVTPLIALWLRTDGLADMARFTQLLVLYTILGLVVRISVFIPLGMYARYWRYASIDELAQIVLAVTVATVIIAIIFIGLFPIWGLYPRSTPRSLPFIDGLLVLIAVGGLRYSLRVLEGTSRTRNGQTEPRKRVLVVGAGDTGVIIVREMQANPQLDLEPVAFVDDDPRKHGATIHRVRVVGDCRQIPSVARAYKVQQAIIAMPTAPGEVIRTVTRLCQEANLPVKTVPGIFEILDGSVGVNELRPLEITDLLRREPVALDMTRVRNLLNQKRVLVTGAGGSIGGELSRQIARGNPALLVLMGHGENSIFDGANDLGRVFPQLDLRTIIADIRDAERLRVVFDRYRPQVVFHAAAHKHVPLMEENAEDAVTNNVLGTRNLVQIAANGGVEYLVLISTDKAVNPTSVMGATKRVAELLVQQAAARTGRCFVAVRFGNVLDSRGSVIPFFKRQIAQGGPVTVTHPEVKRYFMTIPEAVQLVLQAAAMGKGGELFVLDMGGPVKIVDLARDLIRLSGLVEGRDIEIVFTGLRPGEKLSEELFISDENYDRTAHEKIFAARNGALHIPFSAPDYADLDHAVDALITTAQAGDVNGIRRLLRVIVPEYRPVDNSAEPAMTDKPGTSMPPAGLPAESTGLGRGATPAER